ncbi:MAG TPA: RNA methyltransferase [Acidimicrobiales bacterium]|nr:RNA methyltransferase [Acidimicrobiales bacterium]
MEGERAVRVALRSRWPIVSVLLSDTKADKVADLVTAALAAGADVLVATPRVLSAVAGFNVHRGLLALAPVPPPRRPLEAVAGARLMLVAEAVNDHENVGALFRNAAAFGAGAVLLDPRCAEPLYRRSVRVSLGQVLRLPFARVQPWPGGLGQLKAAGVRLVALSPGAGRTLADLQRTDEPTAVMVGSEADGLSAGALSLADEAVRIPMAAEVDSINVATAAAIALHHLGVVGWPA